MSLRKHGRATLAGCQASTILGDTMIDAASAMNNITQVIQTVLAAHLVSKAGILGDGDAGKS